MTTEQLIIDLLEENTFEGTIEAARVFHAAFPQATDEDWAYVDEYRELPVNI